MGAELSEVLLIAPPDLARYGTEHTPAFVGFFPQLDGPLGRSEALLLATEGGPIVKSAPSYYSVCKSALGVNGDVRECAGSFSVCISH